MAREQRLASSNSAKLFTLTSDSGFVLFGHRLSGTPNAVVAPLFGLLLLEYTAGIWQMKRWALPMAFAYAGYVLVNLIRFQLWGPKPEGAGLGYALFGLLYVTVAFGVSFGAAFALRAPKAELD